MQIIPLLLLILLFGCHPKSHLLEPQVHITPTQHHIGNLPSTFSPLTPEERDTDWGKELLIGNSFGKTIDLYRALTSYKRALVLIPADKVERRFEIQYNIVYSYYLATKYCDVIDEFESSELITTPPSFPAFIDLLIMLFDSYQKTDQNEKADAILTLIKQYAPEKAEKLELAVQIQEGTITLDTDPEAREFLCNYYRCAKSVQKAQTLNAILPGAGYYYVGQKQSAWTSFSLNALFIGATYHFFNQKNYAAGIITSSLELGWYLGGINGAGLEAKEYNERLYSKSACQFMHQKKLFPLFMIETSF